MSDGIIYEAKPIPPHDPNQDGGKRRAALLGAAGLIAALLLGVAFGATVFRGDGDPEPIAEPTSSTVATTIPVDPAADDPPTTTVVPEALRPQFDSRGSGATRSAPRRGDGGAPTPALPQRPFTWEEVTLDVPAATDVYVQSVHSLDDGFVVVGSGYGPEGESIIMWESSDGTSWTQKDISGEFSNASIWQVQFTDFGAIALGQVFDGDALGVGEDAIFYEGDYGYQAQSTVWTSIDGTNWTKVELTIAGEGSYGYLNTAVVGPSGFLVLGTQETTPVGPVVLEIDGYRLELNERQYTYRLFDAAGTEVAAGSMEQFFNYSEGEDGQAVRDPETGELLTVIPWEEWEQAYADAYESNGPFGGFAYNPPRVVFERDGYRITIDEADFVYTVENLESGELLGTGDMDDFWRGPEPVITDASGTVLLTVDWDTYDQAYERYWSGIEGAGERAFTQELVAFHSTDGVDWDRSTINAGNSSLYFNNVLAADEGYIAYGESYDDYGGGPQVWSSRDGLSWERRADLPSGVWLWGVSRTSDGTLIGLGEGAQGSALWSSADGVAWSEAFGTRIPEDINSYEWFNQAASGGLGTVVVGNRSTDYYQEHPDPLTLTQNDYTLTFDDWDWPPRVTVIDNATEDIVIDVQLGEESLPDGFFYEDGVTTIVNNDRVLIVITDEEWDSAMEARWRGYETEGASVYQEPVATMYFSTDLATWEEVPLAGVFTGYINQVAVGKTAIVMSAQPPEAYLLEEGYELEPADALDPAASFVQPPPLLLIGRP